MRSRAAFVHTDGLMPSYQKCKDRQEWIKRSVAERVCGYLPVVYLNLYTCSKPSGHLDSFISSVMLPLLAFPCTIDPQIFYCPFIAICVTILFKSDSFD